MRIIQVGLGGWGASWFDVARAAEGVEVTAVAELSPERLAGRGPVPAFASLDEALAAADAEAVLVTSPPESHHEVTTAALEAGLHVLCEKPLATSLADARSLVATAQRTGRILMVSQNYRFRPTARAAQQVMADGLLGELLSVTIACRRDMRSILPPGDFRFRMRHPYILDMGIHHLDLLRAITGREIERVYARSWRAPDSPFEHEPAMSAILTLAGGATVTYSGDWAARDAETGWGGRWEILGEHGQLTWDERPDEAAAAVPLTLQRGNRAPSSIDLPELAAIEREGVLRAFRLAVERGGSVETSGADNLKSFAAVMACVESIETGTPVDVSS